MGGLRPLRWVSAVPGGGRAGHREVGMSDRQGGFRAALRHRDFRVLMARFVISGIGSWAYNVALIVFVFEQTQSAAWVGAVTIGRFIPTLLISPYAGVVAERFERRKVILFSD